MKIYDMHFSHGIKKTKQTHKNVNSAIKKRQEELELCIGMTHNTMKWKERIDNLNLNYLR